MTIDDDPAAAYRAVDKALGMADRSDRVRLEVTGPDRAKFLHNLTTNEIKRLADGRGCEAFVTSLQGKALGYLIVLNAGDRLIVRTDPGGWDSLRPHFEKYGALDEVAWEETGGRTFEFHLAGPLAEEAFRKAGGDPPAVGDLAHAPTTLAGRAVRVIREAPTGRPGLTVIGDRQDADAIVAALREVGGPLGMVEVDPDTFEALRIEAGTPVNGRDVTPENLPQEVGRDDRAINFVKGCYLGQETVARIDALGHVNKTLKGLRIEGEAVPPPGTDLEAGGKVVGTITSSSASPGGGRPIALAYLRMAHAAPGTTLTVVLGDLRPTAVVADLPMRPPVR